MPSGRRATLSGVVNVLEKTNAASWLLAALARSLRDGASDARASGTA
jgi:hypothetical protein